MSFPKPFPGMVIRYSYLWVNKAKDGHEEGRKNRPCAIIFTTEEANGTIKTQVLPVTHTAPSNVADAVEIPKRIKDHLGLDDERSWVSFGELNVFAWPGYDLRLVGKSGSPVYGVLPSPFFRYVRSQFLARRNFKATDRT